MHTSVVENLLFPCHDCTISPTNLRGPQEPECKASPPRRMTGCDSSDCLLCWPDGPPGPSIWGLARQGQGPLCCWSHRSPPQQPPHTSAGPDADEGPPRPPSSKRHRGSSSTLDKLEQQQLQLKLDGNGSVSIVTGTLDANSGEASWGEEEPAGQPCCRPPSCWAWREEFQELQHPAPAWLRPVLCFAPPSSSLRDKASSDICCGLQFSEDGRWLAAAGVAKQLRLYSVMPQDLCQRPVDGGAPEAPSPVAVHRLPAKVSCLAWQPGANSIVTLGDYDGTLSQLDVAQGHAVQDVDAHDGRRIWSLAYSPLRHQLCASSSDDGTCKIWAGPHLSRPVIELCPAGGAAVCCVDFSSADENAVVLASSDHSVYLYDLRVPGQPRAVLQHHLRPVSYAKFFGAGRLVSASVDGSLALWRLDPTPSVAVASPPGLDDPPASSPHSGLSFDEQQQATAQARGLHLNSSNGASPKAATPAALGRSFRGHRNRKNFVGLAVRPDDNLLACGSEGPDAFVYHTSWDAPLARQRVDVPAPAPGGGDCEGGDGDGAGGVFVSAVAWQPARVPHSCGPLLAAATSSGHVQLLVLAEPR